MLNVPIILLAFSNDRKGNFLRSIAEEQKVITEALYQAQKNKKCELIILPNATIDDIVGVFMRERNRIRIFHFGGHSNSFHLLLTSSNGKYNLLKGIDFADFLSEQPALELIFLNGCANKAQYQAFLSAGVKNIIITNTRINDNAAKEFARLFYFSMATGATIQKAFAESSITQKAKYGSQFRGLLWDELGEDDNSIAWEYLPLKEEFGKWKLPTGERTKWFMILMGILIFLSMMIWIAQSVLFSSKPFSYTFFLKTNPEMAALPSSDNGIVSIKIRDEIKTGTIRNGEVQFRNIPAEYKGKEIPLQFKAYTYHTIDTLIGLQEESNTLVIEHDCMFCKIEGIVKDEDSNVLPNVILNISGDIQCKSDQDGHFMFQIPYLAQQPEVRIRASKETYLNWDRIITLVENFPIIITMRKKS